MNILLEAIFLIAMVLASLLFILLAFNPFSFSPFSINWNDFAILLIEVLAYYYSIQLCLFNIVYNSTFYSKPSKFKAFVCSVLILVAIIGVGKYFIGFNNYKTALTVTIMLLIFILRGLCLDLLNVVKYIENIEKFKLELLKNEQNKMLKAVDSRYWGSGYDKNNIFSALMFVKSNNNQNYCTVIKYFRAATIILFVTSFVFSFASSNKYSFDLPLWLIDIMSASIMVTAFSSLTYSANLSKFSKQLKRINHTQQENLEKTDFVLLLRPFCMDDTKIINPNSDFMSHWEDLTFEEAVCDILRSLGSVITIGRPEEQMSLSGADKRIYLPSQSWKNEVESYIKTAKLVVIIPDSSEGIEWELKKIEGLKDISKVIILMPPICEFASESVVRYIKDLHLLQSKFRFMDPTKVHINGDTIAIFFNGNNAEELSLKSNFVYKRLQKFQQAINKRVQ